MNLMATTKRKMTRKRSRPVDLQEALKQADPSGEVKVALDAMRDAQRARTMHIAEFLEVVGGYHRLGE